MATTTGRQSLRVRTIFERTTHNANAGRPPFHGLSADKMRHDLTGYTYTRTAGWPGRGRLNSDLAVVNDVKLNPGKPPLSPGAPKHGLAAQAWIA